MRITWGSVLPGLFGPPGAAIEMLERGKSVQGGDLWPQTSTRFITTLHSMKNPNTWARVPTHQDVIGYSADIQMPIYADRAWRERVIAEGQALCETTNFLDHDMDWWFERTSVVETELHKDLIGVPLLELGNKRGEHPFHTMIELALEENLETRFQTRSRATYDELRALVQDRRTVLGAHDGGAHVDMLCDACFPSTTCATGAEEARDVARRSTVWPAPAETSVSPTVVKQPGSRDLSPSPREVARPTSRGLLFPRRRR